MSDESITYLTDVVMLTVVVQRGKVDTVLKAAREVGVGTGAVSYFAKGIGIRERLGLLGLAVEVEQDVIHLLVSSEQQDAVLEYLYEAGELATPGMGYVYITPVEKLATFIPENLRKRLEEPEAPPD